MNCLASSEFSWLVYFLVAPRSEMLWKRHFFDLEDDEKDIKLEKLYLFAEAADYTCTVNDEWLIDFFIQLN